MKIYLLLSFFISFSYSTIISDIEKNPNNIVEILKKIDRGERKDICLALLNKNIVKNPKLSYSAANCLLYNGYGDLAIPLFTKYIFGKENKKYFGSRIGYGWLHSSDWYDVGSILSKMTGNKDIYTWITDEISKEVHSHPKKYNLTLGKILNMDLKRNYRENKISKDEIELFKSCQKTLFINFKGIYCNFERPLYKNCKRTDNLDLVIKCLK